MQRSSGPAKDAVEKQTRHGVSDIKGEDATGTGHEVTVSIDKKGSSSRFTLAGQLRATVFSSWLNLLLLFIPAGFAVKYARCSAATVFSLNFLAIIPSNMMVSIAIEEIGYRIGDLLCALLNTTFR